jgi:hypothetical protein
MHGRKGHSTFPHLDGIREMAAPAMLGYHGVAGNCQDGRRLGRDRLGHGAADVHDHRPDLLPQLGDDPSRVHLTGYTPLKCTLDKTTRRLPASLACVLVFALSAAGYFLMERPIMCWGRRLGRPLPVPELAAGAGSSAGA